VTIVLDAPTHRLLEEAAQGRSVSELLREIVAERLRR
jgi:hypothetical protein